MTTKSLSRLYALIGAVLAIAILVICVIAQSMEPKMMSRPAGASRCAEAMLSRISAGDFAGASAYLYGNPKLDSGAERSSEVSGQIWNAFASSISYSLVGESYATTTGIAQDVRIRSLDISSVTGGLQQRAKALMAQRVEEAEDMDEVYDDNYAYRDTFIAGVLRDAAEAALSEDGTYTEHALTLNLVYEQGQWLVVPDKALLGAISGGILG